MEGKVIGKNKIVMKAKVISERRVQGVLDVPVPKSYGSSRENLDSLPRFVAFQSVYDKTFMLQVKEEGTVHRHLKFSGTAATDPEVKYAVEPAKCGNGLVHIRSCYNNKYWVMSNKWIVAKADKPNEDRTQNSCTLFQPISIPGSSKNFRIRHVQTGNNICLWRTSPPHDSCVLAGYNTPDQSQCDIFTAIDWESLVVLPKHVAFKGDNGMYLQGTWYDGKYQHLEFSATHNADTRVGMQIFPNADGTISLKSNYFGDKLYWKRQVHNWILVEATSIDSASSFLPIKVDDNVIALRTMHEDKKFCKRFTSENKVSCLSASDNTISQYARIKVEELVLSRAIYDTRFRPKDARVYNETPLVMAVKTSENNTDETHSAELNFAVTETRTSCWKSSTSLKLGVKTSFKVGIPLIGETAIEISGEYDKGYEWGETVETKMELSSVYKATVPPRTRVKVSLVASQAKCDVPFSYTQRDVRLDGTTVVYRKDDGMYTGLNSYKFNFDAVNQKL